VSADVNFQAATFKSSDGSVKFSQTVYEEKPSNWKLCFRAGKETVAAARTAAKEWLDELKRGT